MNTTHHDSDVIIVGAGPVGLMLATSSACTAGRW